jgi:uncharacterized protein (TIGR03000 family)
LTFQLVAPTSDVETVVTLNVPADARVELAGAPTRLHGTRRVFATTGLPAGKVWKDYKVVVSWERAGRTISKERTLTILGGERYELSFGADADALAHK